MDRQEKQEKTLKIISLFRERESLWNKNSVSYRRNDVRKKAIEEIAEECNMTEEAVKKRLKALRSTYVLEKKKVDQSQASGCDAADVYQPLLSWYEEMSFLDESISTRKPKDNVSNNNLHESLSSYPDVSCAPSSPPRKRKYKQDIDTSRKRKNQKDINTDTEFDKNNLDESLSSYPDVSCAPSSPSRKRKYQQDINTSRKSKHQKDINTDTEFDKALKQFVTTNMPDVFSSFADYMAMMLRSMPEKSAYLAMKDIQNVLYESKFPNPEVVAGAKTKQHTSSSKTRASEIFPVKLFQIDND